MLAQGRIQPIERFGQQLVIQGQHPPRLERRFQRHRVGLTRNVLEQLVDRVAPLEHRIIFLSRADQVRQRELLARQVQLDRVREGDLVRIILPPRAAFEQELALLADDQQLGGLARPAGILDDRVDHPDVEMRHHDREFFRGKLLALPRLAGLSGSGSAGMDGDRRARLHETFSAPPRTGRRSRGNVKS